MAHYTDWLPATRDAQLAMALVWNAALAKNAAAWNVPAAVARNLRRGQEMSVGPLVNALIP